MYSIQEDGFHKQVSYKSIPTILTEVLLTKYVTCHRVDYLIFPHYMQ